MPLHLNPSVTVGPTYVYSYNDAMQLDVAQHYDASVLGGTLTYSYGGDGNRLKRVSDTDTQYSIYNYYGQLLGEYDAAGVAAGKEYFYINRMQIASAKSVLPVIAKAESAALTAKTKSIKNVNTSDSKLAPRNDTESLLYAPYRQQKSNISPATLMPEEVIRVLPDFEEKKLIQSMDIGIIQSTSLIKAQAVQGGSH